MPSSVRDAQCARVFPVSTSLFARPSDRCRYTSIAPRRPSSPTQRERRDRSEGREADQVAMKLRPDPLDLRRPVGRWGARPVCPQARPIAVGELQPLHVARRIVAGADRQAQVRVGERADARPRRRQHGDARPRDAHGQQFWIRVASPSPRRTRLRSVPRSSGPSPSGRRRAAFAARTEKFPDGRTPLRAIRAFWPVSAQIADLADLSSRTRVRIGARHSPNHPCSPDGSGTRGVGTVDG